MEFKQLLTKFREQSGISKAELSRKIDLTTGNYIGSLEEGKQSAPTIELCKKITGALRLDENETNLLLHTAAEERISVKLPDEFSILRGSLIGGTTKKPYPNNWKPPDITMRVPVLKSDDVNKFITDDDVPIGGEYVNVSKSAAESTYALRVASDQMIPEFHPGDIVVIEQCTKPQDGDFVLVADHKGKTPLLRQYKDYGKVRLFHPLNSEYKDIVLDDHKQYAVVGKVIERIARAKLY